MLAVSCTVVALDCWNTLARTVCGGRGAIGVQRGTEDDNDSIAIAQSELRANGTVVAEAARRPGGRDARRKWGLLNILNRDRGDGADTADLLGDTDDDSSRMSGAPARPRYDAESGLMSRLVGGSQELRSSGSGTSGGGWNATDRGQSARWDATKARLEQAAARADERRARRSGRL